MVEHTWRTTNRLFKLCCTLRIALPSRFDRRRPPLLLLLLCGLCWCRQFAQDRLVGLNAAAKRKHREYAAT